MIRLSNIGFPSIGNIGFGVSFVSSFNRDPSPPAKINTAQSWFLFFFNTLRESNFKKRLLESTKGTKNNNSLSIVAMIFEGESLSYITTGVIFMIFLSISLISSKKQGNMSYLCLYSDHIYTDFDVGMGRWVWGGPAGAAGGEGRRV